MPKERISRSIPTDMPEDGVLHADDGVYVSLHWGGGVSRSHDGDIQISLDVDIQRLKDMLDEHARGIHYSDTDTSDQVMLFSGELDRDSLQRLIRSARVARNSAFGRDE